MCVCVVRHGSVSPSVLMGCVCVCVCVSESDMVALAAEASFSL